VEIWSVRVRTPTPAYNIQQWWSPSWAEVGHGPPGKIKKSTIIGVFCEILYNFMSVLGFG